MRKYLLLFILMNATLICFSQTASVNELLNVKGQAVTTIHHNTITDNYGRTLAQLLNDQPGIVINGAYQPVGSLVSIYMEGTLGGRALILIDGIPVYDPSSLPDYFDINLISLYEIESIDIYHGTQSSTMGNGAFAGAINIITIKKNVSKPVQLSAAQSIGNENTLNSNLQLYGSTDRWNYAASYSHLSTNGFSLAHDSVGNKGFDNDGYTGNILNTHVAYSAGKYLQWKANCLYSQYKADSDGDAFQDSKQYYYNNKQLNLGTGFIVKKNNTLLVGNYQYSSSNHYFHYDNEYHENYVGKANFAELYLQQTLSSKLKLLLGTDYSSAYMNNAFYDSTYGQEHLYPTINMFSTYGKISYSTKDSSLGIDIAARATHHTAYGWVYSYNIGADYKLTKAINLFAGIATGFKSACLYQLYNNYGSADSALVPEKTLNYHLGISFRQKQFTQRLRLYYYTSKDLIYWDNNISMYDNFNKQKTWGLQYEMEWKLNTNFSITANYTLLKGQDYTIGHQRYSDTVTYPYLFRRPEHVVNMGIHYAIKSFKIGISGRYVSDYYDVNPGNTDYIIPHFVVLNAYSNYTFHQHWQVFASIQNLLNNTFYDVTGLNSIPMLINCGIRFQL